VALPPEQEWALRGLARRSDSFADAYTVILDHVPLTEFRDENHLERVLQVLDEARLIASEEHSRLKKEFGLIV
jgi:hypothetical protein